MQQRTLLHLKRLFLPLLVLLLVFPSQGRAQHIPYFQYLDHPWVDSVLSTLSLEQRIAQTIWVSTGTGEELSRYLLLDALVREHGIGGLYLEEWDANAAAELIGAFRSVPGVPLAFALEGGATQAWKGGSYPGPLSMYAISDGGLRIRMGEQLAREMKLLGAQVWIAPYEEGDLTRTLREENLLVTRKYLPVPGDPGLEWLMAELPGFRGMIAADGAGTVSLAACFDPAAMEIGPLLKAVVESVESGGVDTLVINQRARLVLAFKYWSGLSRSSRAREAEAAQTIKSNAHLALVRDLYAASLTLLNNNDQLLPLGALDRTRIATLAIGREGPTAFQVMAGNYTRMDHFNWFPGSTPPDSLAGILSGYDVVLAALYPDSDDDRVKAHDPDSDDDRGMAHDPDLSRSRQQISELFSLLTGLRGNIASPEGRTRLVTVCFGDPEGPGGGEQGWMEEMPGLSGSDALLLAYEENSMTGELAAELIFGAIGARGRLPFALNAAYPAGSGMATEGGIRIQYAFPENAGVSSRILLPAVDSIVKAGLEAGAFPGCEVIAARRGKVILHRAYGYHTYDRRIAVQPGDLYDLASVTKVSGPLAGLMVLEGRGAWSHNETLGSYAPSMKGSDKAGLPLKDILAHQAGLTPWIPYWKDAVRKNGRFKRRYIREDPSGRFPLPVADHLYLNPSFRKQIYRDIRKSELGENTYLYSGLAFFLFPQMIEELSGEGYEQFLSGEIYHTLGAWDLVFNPLRLYPLTRIVPTEYDSLFRKQQVQGYVHDESAAMMGGFSGNAGLFSTANDLMKLFEMYRRMGSYGGEQIIPAEVLQEYTRVQFPENGNRRGLGFDKPLIGKGDGTPGDYPCPGASSSSFGHSGFTGTFVWADPAHEITYEFLSNRVYPTRNNNLLSDMNIRTSILQAIYDAIVPDE